MHTSLAIASLLRRLVVVLVLLAAIGAPRAAAAANDLVINISEPYGGYCRPGHWYPLLVTIQNQPKEGKVGDTSLDFDGQLIFESASLSNQMPSYQFVREVKVPAYSIQRFNLLVKIRENPTAPMLTVRTATGRLVQTIPVNVNPLGTDQTLMVTVSKDARQLNIPMFRFGAVNTLARAVAPPKDLPTTWAGYDSVDILVLPSWEEGGMQNRNVAALKDWVSMGGTLVVLGGESTDTYTGQEGAAELLPVTLAGTEKFTIDSKLRRLNPVPEGEKLDPANPPHIVSVSKPVEGAEVLLDGSGGTGAPIPIMVRKAMGRGQVVFIGFDLETTSRDVRDLLGPTWMGLIPLSNVMSWDNFVADNIGKITIPSGRAARPPNVVFIILVCILYTAVVGPLNFYILGKQGRVQWAWFTVPVIVLLFSGVIYTVGTLSKGRNVIGRQVTLLLGAEGQKDFDEHSYVGLFVPGARDYQVKPLQDNQTVCDSDRWREEEKFVQFAGLGSFADSGAAPLSFAPKTRTIVNDDQQAWVSNWPLRTFDTATWEVRGPRTLEGGIDSTLRMHSDRNQVWFEGTVTNNTGIDFSASQLATGGRAVSLGALKSGEKKTIGRTDFVLGANDTQRPGALDTIQNLFPASSVTSEEDSAINLRNAGVVVGALFEPHPQGSSVFPPLNGRLCFVGVSQDKDLTVTLSNKRDEGSRAIAMVVELNPVPAPGPFLVPPSMVQVRLQDYQKDGKFALKTDSTPGIEMFASDAVVSVELPFRHPGIRAQVLTNDVQANADPEFQLFDVGAFDFAEGPVAAKMGEQWTDRNGTILTPYSGRAWVIMKAQEPKEKKSTINPTTFGRFADVSAVRFGVMGTMEGSQE